MRRVRRRTAVSTAPPACGLPLVRVITTGGTIASRPTTDGLRATTPGAELLDAVPGLGEVARIQVDELFRIGSRIVDEFCSFRTRGVQNIVGRNRLLHTGERAGVLRRAHFRKDRVVVGDGGAGPRRRNRRRLDFVRLLGELRTLDDPAHF